MNISHVGLKSRWKALTTAEQMANIGAEVGRMISWRERNETQSRDAFYRALELLDYTIDDPKNKKSLKEILRVREVLTDYYVGNNIYGLTDEGWKKYFLYFNFLARKNK
jgi:hypothetical protein